MARYFFHLTTATGYSVDDVGAEFADAEAAFLCAHETAIEMSVDLLREHGDPSRHIFEIADANQVVLFTLPFSEATRMAPPAAPPGVMHANILKNMRRAADAASKLKQNVERTRALLRETRSLLK